MTSQSIPGNPIFSSRQNYLNEASGSFRTHPNTFVPRIKKSPCVAPSLIGYPRKVLDTFSNKLPERPPLPRERIVVSNAEVAPFLLGAYPVLQKLTHGTPEIIQDSRNNWGRDARVTLPSGEHLIPYGFTRNHETFSELRSLLPTEQEAMHQTTLLGNGCFSEYRSAAFAHAIAAKVPVKKNTLSCIEGGNCRIFKGSDGTDKALVGWNSVLLTMMALNREGEFQTPAFQKFATEYAADKKTPDMDSIRIARNHVYFCEDLALYQLDPEKNPPPGYRTVTTQPTQEEIDLFSDGALAIEAGLILAKRQIAHDLGIPIERIAFLLQDQFHIDLSCFAATDDVVFLQDPSETLSLLESLQSKVRGRDVFDLEDYIRNAQSSRESSQTTLEKNRIALEKIGCKGVLIAGDFRSMRTRINFMNSLLVPNRNKPLLLTNGTRNSPLNLRLKAEFLSRIQNECPDLEVVFIADQTDVMQTLLHKNNGGLHCATFTSCPQEPVSNPEDNSDPLHQNSRTK